MIFDFDDDERLEEIDKHYENVKQLNDSLADSREKYRNFSEEINLSIRTLESCIDTYEKSLLISCYTFSEKLMKNVIYHMIDKGNHSNEYTNKFIENKVPSNRYVPDVRIQEIEKSISALEDGFKFILPQNLHEFTIYNEMIRVRHTYAHAYNYIFDFNNFDLVIKVLKYLSFEYRLLIDFNEKRKTIYNSLKEIKKLSLDISKVKREKRSKKNPKIKQIRKEAKKFVDRYSVEFNQYELLIPLITRIIDISQINLKVSAEHIHEIYEKCAEIHIL
jgi:uncharacterized protein YoxC